MGSRRASSSGTHVRLAAMAAAGAACALMLALPAGAAAGGGSGVRLKVRTSRDRAALSAGGLKLVARSSHRRRLALTARAFKGGPALTVRRRASVHAGANPLKLRLSKAGRKLLNGCAARRVIVTATPPHGGKSLASARRTLKRTVPQCKALNTASRCETIAAPGSDCLFPWPNDHFTVAAGTGTGRRLALSLASTPANVAGVHLDPTELNRSDGFSPGVSIVTHVPGMDTPAAFQKTGAVPVTDMARAFDAGQPIVLIDAATRQRQLIWSELDSEADTPANTDLIIRVGKNLIEGHRYIVAMRNLKTAAGKTIAAPPGFALYRDGVKTNVGAIEKRRAHFKALFKTLGKAGIKRSSLYDAWDFTVASTDNITGRMLHIRNDGLHQLGDDTPGDGVEQGSAPDFTITNVKTVDEKSPDTIHEALTGSHAVENVREVTGTFQVPCYLDQTGCPSGSRFNLGSNGLPKQMPGNTYTAGFTCNIPRSAVNEVGGGGTGVWELAGLPDRASMYGHGLFGTKNEVHTTNVRQLGNDEGVVTCATDFIGMADEDEGEAALHALLNLSNFPPIPDRLQQGFLDFVYLGRLMSMPDGFASDDAFKFGGTSVIDTSPGNLFYYGNSQGGIAGGALTAIEPDITRTVLYVPGMNYSTLLTRSVDFDSYANGFLYPSYPVVRTRPLLLSMIQTMWDRGEPDGYANHMTSNPLPGTPAHHVLIEMAYGDHQVTNVATEVEARTIGAPLRHPTLDPGRALAYTDFFPSLPTLGALPGPAEDGNGFFVWDIGPLRSGDTLGTTDPPTTNTPNRPGVDPHDTVIDTSSDIRHQIAEFIKPGGKIVDVCGLAPCYAAGWTGPGP